MFYKLSNSANKETIEDTFAGVFKYPNLYQPKTLIDGLQESTLEIITIEEPKQINYSIWGLLPENFEDNWDVFQNMTNTLNVNVEPLNMECDFYESALNNRRCLIVVTGFFTSFLNNGSIHPYHIHLKNFEPFCIAGIYNQLKDGFLTCSILITKAKDSFLEIPNLSGLKPVVLNPIDHELWLDKTKSYDDLKVLLEHHERLTFESHPVKEEFYEDPEMFKKISQSKSFEQLS